MQKARCHPAEAGLQQIVSKWFQVLFHSPSGVLFTFPSRYYFAIGHIGVFSLSRWSWEIPTEFLVFHGTWVRLPTSLQTFFYRTITFYGLPFQSSLNSLQIFDLSSVLPHSPKTPRYPCSTTPAGFNIEQVWALSRSLAATRKITFVFFSWSY